MAGDWIKVQKDTPEKPEVQAIAFRLGIDPDAVVGKLVRVWSWFDTHTKDGNAQCVTFALLDRLTSVTGFAEHMKLVGWLDTDGVSLILPNFNFHNGATAKTRANGKNRSEKHRSNADTVTESVTEPSPEKRREEKRREEEIKTGEKQRERRTPPAKPIDQPGDVDPQTWADFIALRNKKRAPVTATVINGARQESSKAGMTLEAFLQVWCRRGSQGLEASWLKPDELSQSGGQIPNRQEALEARNRAVVARMMEKENQIVTL